MNEEVSDRELFQGMNRTDLLQVCQRIGLRPSSLLPKDRLIDLIIGETATYEGSELDEWRHGIMGFLLEYWSNVYTQLKCPASSKDPRSCFNCLDTQVLYCLKDNHTRIPDIRTFNKKEPRIMSESANVVYTVENCPRDLAVLEESQYGQYKAVLEHLRTKGIGPSTSDERRAFFQLTPKEKAKELLGYLGEWDAKEGGGAKKAPATKKEEVKRDPVSEADEAAADNDKKKGASSKKATPAAAAGATQVVDLSEVISLITAQNKVIAEQGKAIAELREELRKSNSMLTSLGEANLLIGGSLMEKVLQKPSDLAFEEAASGQKDLLQIVRELDEAHQADEGKG